MDFVLAREIIKIESVRSKMLDGNIGYIRVTQFQDQTAKDVSAALRKLHEQKMQSLILDLRNNPGGLLTSAVEVSEQFVGPNRLIVYIKTREGRKDEYVSHSKEQPDDYPDRKSTRLNSSHLVISYAVFCLKKKKNNTT